MDHSKNGTGIIYPEITLDDVTYTLKISREVLLYRLSAKGVRILDLRGPKSFATLFDLFHAIIQDRYSGTVEDLVTLAHAEDKVAQIDSAMAEVIKKVFPSTPMVLVATQKDAPAVQ